MSSTTLTLRGEGSGQVFEASYRVLGYRFGVRTDIPAVGRELDRALTPFRARGAPEGPVYSVRFRPRKRVYAASRGTRVLIESEAADHALDYVLWDVNAEVIRRTDRYLMVHAGVVAWKRRGVVLPARMDSGKTTLSAGLVRAGFSYLSDEAALLDPGSGKVHPYPKSLTMEPEGLFALRMPPPHNVDWAARPQRRRRHILANELRRGSVAMSAIPVRYVIAPDYRPWGPTQIVPVSRAEGLHLLAKHAFNLERFGSTGLTILRTALEDAKCYRLFVGNLESAVRAVRELVVRGRSGVYVPGSE